MGLVLAVANQKGGSGKTTIPLNLAGAYCDDDPGLRVLVMDADYKRRRGAVPVHGCRPRSRRIESRTGNKQSTTIRS
jgi:CO dehydrogenase nickel-insertion accessory protein CooC1